jgi:hypothetical protein
LHFVTHVVKKMSIIGRIPVIGREKAIFGAVTPAGRRVESGRAGPVALWVQPAGVTGREENTPKSEGDMNAERKSGRRTSFCGVVAAILALAFPCLEGNAADQWRLIPVEVEGETDTMVADFALGADGTPWVALARPQDTICYWQEGKWHRLAGNFVIRKYMSGPRFYVSAGKVYLALNAGEGGPDRQSPAKQQYGSIYLLKDKRAEFVADYYCDLPRIVPRLFFDSKGRIWNWGDTFLEKFEDGRWDRVQATMNGDPQIVDDMNGNVYFFAKTLSYYRNGQFTLNARLPSFAWEQLALRCCLWGTDKVVLISGAGRGAMVFDLNTLTFSDVLHSAPLPEETVRAWRRSRSRGSEDPLQNQPPLVRSRLGSLFRDAQGNVWVLAYRENSRDRFYIRISATGDRVEEKPETAAIYADQMFTYYVPHAIRCAKDGTIYFGGVLNGVYVYHDGKLTHAGWQQGLAVNMANWVYEHPDGTVWFASRRTGIAVYDPCGVPGTDPTSPFQTTWEQYALANEMVVQDFEGGLWCCLKDKPRKLSHWNGRVWEHFDVDFDTAYLPAFVVDNLRRLHIFSVTERRFVFCRFAEGRVERFADFKAMILDSVRTGSRAFRSGGAYPSRAPLVVNEQEVWCIEPTVARLMRFSAGGWHEVRADPHSSDIFRRTDQGVLIGTQRGFLTLEGGQLIEFADEHTRHQEYLLGPSGLQPFDRDVYERNPSELFPARKTQETIYVFSNLTDFNAFREDNVPLQAVKFSKYFDRLWLAEGGFWAYERGTSGLRRYYKGLLLTVDLAVTPAPTEFGAIFCHPHEETNRDIWIRDYLTLFRVQRPKLDTRITTPQTAECASPTLRIEFDGTSDGPEGEPLMYAWRLDGGPWSGPTGQTYADLEFTQPGPHEFEVLAVGSMGNVDTTPAVQRLSVTLPVPEVRIVSAPQGIVTDLDVAIVYEVVKRSEGSRLTFQWRLDGGTWHDTREMTIRPIGLPDGEHILEVRAVADGKYVQAPPASVRFEVRVNYDQAITAAIQQLHSNDYAQREAAAQRLAFLGSRCLPYLKKELERSDEDTRWWIRAVIGQIED